MIITYAFRNNQNLPAGMCMPVGSYPRLKRYKRYNAVQRIAGGNKPVKPYCSIEIITGRDFFTAWENGVYYCSRIYRFLCFCIYVE